jgi:hypothetical protein
MGSSLLLYPLRFLAAGTVTTYCPYGDSSCNTGLAPTGLSDANVQSLLEAAFAIIGVVAVILVVIGGLQFILAQGDPQSVARARKTVIYAVIGLGVAVSAEVIVAFVVNKVSL